MSIKTKFILSVGLIIAGIAALSGYLYFERETADEYQRLEQFVSRIGMVLEHDIADHMSTGRHELQDAYLFPLLKFEPIAAIRLVNAAGVVTRSTYREEIGSQFPLKSVGDGRTAGGKPRGTYLEKEKMYRLIQPIANKRECHVCHHASAGNNGAFIVDFRSEEVHGNVWKDINRALAIFFPALVAIGATVYLISSRMIIARINRLTESLRQFKEGDYGVKLPLSNNDEITDLKRAFNEMGDVVRRRDREKEELLKQITCAGEKMGRLYRRHAELIDSLDSIVWEADACTFRFTFVSKQAERILGYPVRQWLEEPLFWKEHVHPEDRDWSASLCMKASAEKRPHELEYRILAADGRVVWVHDVVSVVADKDGAVALRGVMVDVTERKEAERKINDAFAEARARKAENEALLQSARAALKYPVFGQAVREIFDRCKELIGASAGYVTLASEDGLCNSILVLDLDGMKRDVDQRLTIPMSGMWGESFRSGRPLYHNDFLNSEWAQFLPPGHVEIRNVLFAPLIAEGKSVGLFAFGNKPGGFTEADARRAAEFCEIAIISYVNERADRALLASKQRYKKLVESTTSYIYTVSVADGLPVATAHGPGCATVTGYTSEDYAADSNLWYRMVHPDDRDRVLDQAKNILAGEAPPALEHRIVHKDGTIRWVKNTPVPHRDAAGSLVAYDGLISDITERRKAEMEREKLIAELQEVLGRVTRSKQEWQLTFDNITDLISIHDKDFNIIRHNRAFAQYFGFDCKEPVRVKCHELFQGTCFSEGRCPHGAAQVDAPFGAWEYADVNRKKLLKVTTFPFHSAEGEVLGSIHLMKNITEEREKETQVMMQERLATLGQVSSGIAHEINNPLASIAGCAEGLLARVRKGRYDGSMFEQYLNIVLEEVGRCKNITSAMLSIVRRTSYDRQACDVNAVLDKTLEIIGFQGRLREVEVSKAYQESIPPIHASEGELKQVFIILLSNAIEAMENRGAIAIETRIDDGTVRLAISDTGPGMPPEHLDRIFDPFFTTKQEKGGTGLGLSIARRIIASHRGLITAASAPGKGTTFSIMLPASLQRETGGGPIGC
ncbi:MAG: PAS domain S-box protein [Nitrospirota bacterium]|nr:PAS domain S-box protein [Nitrospirota bacterium]